MNAGTKCCASSFALHYSILLSCFLNFLLHFWCSLQLHLIVRIHEAEDTPYVIVARSLILVSRNEIL